MIMHVQQLFMFILLIKYTYATLLFLIFAAITGAVALSLSKFQFHFYPIKFVHALILNHYSWLGNCNTNNYGNHCQKMVLIKRYVTHFSNHLKLQSQQICFFLRRSSFWWTGHQAWRKTSWYRPRRGCSKRECSERDWTRRDWPRKDCSRCKRKRAVTLMPFL